MCTSTDVCTRVVFYVYMCCVCTQACACVLCTCTFVCTCVVRVTLCVHVCAVCLHHMSVCTCLSCVLVCVSTCACPVEAGVSGAPGGEVWRVESRKSATLVGAICVLVLYSPFCPLSAPWVSAMCWGQGPWQSRCPLSGTQPCQGVSEGGGATPAW